MDTRSIIQALRNKRESLYEQKERLDRDRTTLKKGSKEERRNSEECAYTVGQLQAFREAIKLLENL